MKHEPVVLIVDSREIFDEISPVISKELGTTQLIHVTNRAEAASIIESQIHFDIIFVDWQLVGAKFVDEIRDDRLNGCTPLIVMSELDTDVVIATATRHGASGFLAKPFLTRGLLATLSQVAAKQERRRKMRLCPDHPVNVVVDTERVGAIEGALTDFSLDYSHIRFDRSHREELIIGDSALAHLNLEDHKIDLGCVLVRLEQDGEQGESILALYQFSDSHEIRVEKLEELLDEYQSQW